MQALYAVLTAAQPVHPSSVIGDIEFRRIVIKIERSAVIIRLDPVSQLSLRVSAQNFGNAVHFDLRQQLAVYLLPLLGECEILYSMPTVRRPLAAGVTTLVLNDHSVKRSEDTLPGSTPLLLEVGLRLTALHRDSMEAVETLTDAITALTLRGDFPCGVTGLEWAEIGFDRGCGAFARRGLLKVCCALAEAPEEEDEA